jgi:hypothetical protein
MSSLVQVGGALLGQNDAGLFAAFGGLMILVWIIALLATVFWVWMLIDCLVSNMPTNEKILWALVIIFTHVLGALIYFFVKRSGSGSGSRPAIT